MKLSWFGDDAEARLPEHVDTEEQRYQQVKASIHQTLVESLDLSRIDRMDRNQLFQQIRKMADEASGKRRAELSEAAQQRLVDELMAEVFGLGPLEPLINDPTISDILVNDPYTVYIERHGTLELTDIVFADEAHLMRIIQRIVAKLGRRIDEVSPMVDARLPDGSRVNAIIPPLAIDGPSLSIRRFGVQPLGIEDLRDSGSIHPIMIDFLAAAIESRIGCVVSGGTGAGKTTLLNALSVFIPEGERLVTIEDSAELILRHRHRVRLETRPANSEGAGEVTQRELVRNSLRMRPDRILVGEVRGPEVWDMLQAMNTGHDGSLTTIHSNSSRDALSRLEMMVALSGVEVPVDVIRNYIAAGIRLIVHVARLKGGVRRVMQITEILGVQDHQYQLRDIFGFRQEGVTDAGKAYGTYFASGHLPACLERLRTSGHPLPDSMFREQRFSSAAPPHPASALVGGEQE